MLFVTGIELISFIISIPFNDQPSNSYPSFIGFVGKVAQWLNSIIWLLYKVLSTLKLTSYLYVTSATIFVLFVIV